MKKKILIIGKKGFLGSNLLSFFEKKKLKVHSISFENFLNKYYLFSDKVDFIINCSSNKKFINRKYHIRNDNDLIIARKIINSKIKLIMLSTRKIYKPKFNIKESDQKKLDCNYSINKMTSEILVGKILINRVLILRISNIVGLPNKNKRKIHTTFSDIFFETVKSGFIYDNKETFKDFISIKQFSQIVLELIKENSFGTYNVSLGKKVYLNQLITWLNFYNPNKINIIKKKNSFNNDNFTLNNRKLMRKIKISNNLNDLKNACLVISRKFFIKK
jgi:nucleoside-diphosphate-sugar epimerase